MKPEQHKYCASESRLSTGYNNVIGAALSGIHCCAIIFKDMDETMDARLKSSVIIVGFARGGTILKKLIIS